MTKLDVNECSFAHLTLVLAGATLPWKMQKS